MTHWLIGAAIFVGLALLLLLMRLAWGARGRRQADLPLPETAPGDLGPARVTSDGFYVATTRAGDPLDRIVVGGLGFRGRVIASVHPEGVRLEIAGESAKLIRASSLRDVGRATWAIDRVVEPGGLVLVAWTLGGVDVDTYLRITDDPAAVVDAIRPLVPAPAGSPRTTGEDS
ncbi:hypothetical protein ACPEEZ_07590 [Frigoribacterium sp. 2-23]|uniref:PH-like domain-containing protein n=1 Tax=Frigoribacterium sp. 2-23 TaxID=3415006 RepID=UPI003C6F319C